MQYETIIEFPATKVVRRPVTPEGVTLLRHGEKLGLVYQSARHGKLVRSYRVGTVFGCAVEHYEDPIDARDRNRRNGGADHWINGCGASITAHARPQEVVIFVELGMLVQIEGVLYRIKREPNDNLGLEPVGGAK